MTTLGRALEEATAALLDAGFPRGEARREARLLLAGATGLPGGEVFAYPERALEPAAAERLAGFLRRRAAQEPVSRILGRRGFWDLELRVTPDVLDPRPDSETLIEAAIAAFPEPDAALRILDLGTGSGCLLLALLSHFRAARGLGVDVSQAALAVARENARACALDARAGFRLGDWAERLDDAAFDLVVCNPPYIGEVERESLAPAVRDYDPATALFAGPEGLDAYRALLPQAARVLAPGGLAILELGRGQGPAVTALAEAAGLRVEALRADLGGIDRALVARRPWPVGQT